MPDSRWPLPLADVLANSFKNGLDNSNFAVSAGSAIAQIEYVQSNIVSPYLSDVIPDLLRDETADAETVIARSDSAAPVITRPKKLRGLVFVNYTASPLYLQIHGVTPAPAVGVQPEFPPIPADRLQTVFGDQALLGYDGFGYSACTLRVSTTVVGYTPPPPTAGLWALIARFK